MSEIPPSPPLSSVLPVCGWRERIDIPDWRLRRVRAKIDTGARTSAIDVAAIEPMGDGRIRFEVVGRTSPTRVTRWVEARPVRVSTVRPSSGEPQTRYVCEVPIRIGELERMIEVSLVRREGMLCRMLLGRRALSGLVTVDPSSAYLLTSKRRKTT